MSHSDPFLWRKYEPGIQARRFHPGDRKGTFLWDNSDPNAIPRLYRWPALDKHQVGFVSVNSGPNHARAYSLEGGMEWLWKTHCREYNLGVDAADFGEMVRTSLLGVWMGEKTPYFVSDGQDLNKIVGEFVLRKDDGN